MARAFFASERLSKRYTKTLVSTSAATIVEIFAFPAAVVRLRLFALSALPLFLTLDRRPEHPQAQLDRGRIILTGALPTELRALVPDWMYRLRGRSA